jgi:hypothetical protein
LTIISLVLGMAAAYFVSKFVFGFWWRNRNVVYSKLTQFTQEDGERLIFDEYVGQKIRDFYKILDKERCFGLASSGWQQKAD